MWTIEDVRERIASYVQPDDDGNMRLYNYLRYRQDEIDAELKVLDRRLADAAHTLGIRVSSSWLHQARNSLASDILEREVKDWKEVQPTEHIQIVLWACRTTNSSELRSWMRNKLARR